MRAVFLVGAIAFVMAGPARAQDPTGIGIHGNWCGPGYDSGPVLDVLDAACQRHDFCARREGMFNCGCDLAFIEELRHRSWPSQELYWKARAIYEAIGALPCRGAGGVAQKMDLINNDWRGAVARGREPASARKKRFFWLLGALLTSGK